jgi:hypothetical protein
MVRFPTPVRPETSSHASENNVMTDGQRCARYPVLSAMKGNYFREQPDRCVHRLNECEEAATRGPVGRELRPPLAAEHATRSHDVVNRALPLTLTASRPSIG